MDRRTPPSFLRFLHFPPFLPFPSASVRDYFQHGGILHYVLRQLASQSKAA